MPKKVDSIPGSSGLGALDWNAMLLGGTWFFSIEEIEELGVQIETVRAFSHRTAAELGMKVRTKVTDDGLYLERKVVHPAQENVQPE